MKIDLENYLLQPLPDGSVRIYEPWDKAFRIRDRHTGRIKRYLKGYRPIGEFKMPADQNTTPESALAEIQKGLEKVIVKHIAEQN